jgi:chromosome segregation ATPase
VRDVRNRLLEKARRWGARLRHEQERLQGQRDELLVRRGELERLRLETQRRQRELLELRGTTEHLLAELSAREERGALVEQLSATRTQIAAHYQESRDDLAQQQRALAQLKSEVAARYTQLLHHRDEIIHMNRQRRMLAARAQAEKLLRRNDPPAA